MTIYSKIKKKGFSGCIKSIKCRLIVPYNHIMFRRYLRLPIDPCSIVFESEGDCCDNSFALFDYMKNNGFLDKYKVTWLVEYPENFKKEKNINYVKKDLNSQFNRETIKALRTCQWYIYDHCNIMADFKKRPNQYFIYLSHGWGYKAAKGPNLKKNKSVFDYMTATGPLSAEGLSKYWKMPKEKAKITGYPRLDYLFQDNKRIKEKIESTWHFEKYRKIIFWMPTFRQSVNTGLSEDYSKSETGLPLFESFNSLLQFDAFLKENNILMVFKLHHLQADLPVFHTKFSNINVVRDEELNLLKIQLYQLVKYSDILVSDYSSISIDYLLMNKPIIYTLDDYNDYAESRGLFPSNAIDYMPGYHVYTIEELKNSIIEILAGIDLYSSDRKQIIDDYHTFKDGNSSKRVLKLCGIYK